MYRNTIKMLLLIILSTTATMAQQLYKVSVLARSGFPIQRIEYVNTGTLSHTTFKNFNLAVPFQLGIDIAPVKAGRIHSGISVNYFLLRQHIKNIQGEIIFNTHFNYLSVNPYIEVDCFKNLSVWIGPDLSTLLSYQTFNAPTVTHPLEINTTRFISSVLLGASYHVGHKVTLQVGYNYSLQSFAQESPLFAYLKTTGYFHYDYVHATIKYAFFNKSPFGLFGGQF